MKVFKFQLSFSISNGFVWQLTLQVVRETKQWCGAKPNVTHTLAPRQAKLDSTRKEQGLQLLINRQSHHVRYVRGKKYYFSTRHLVSI